METNKKYDFLIYGVYGYTGDLICRLAKERGMNAAVAGRDAAKTQAQARLYGFDYFVFEITDTQKAIEALLQVKILLNCAGPFCNTVRPMTDACIKTSTHYLDISGEWQVFEYLASLSGAAVKAGIILLPGVGYDVVPSDCLALYLKAQMPNAEKISLAIFSKGGSLSRGTLLTMNEAIGRPAAMRKDGKIIAIPMAKFVREIEIAGKRRLFMNIGWGDISTAWHSTQIPEIITYTAASPRMINMAKISRYIGFFLRLPFVKAISKYRILKRGNPMTEDMQQQVQSFVWGEVVNRKNESIKALITLPDGYVLTAQTALAIVNRILKSPPSCGFQTPAKAFGSEFILSIPETHRELLQ